MTGLLYFAHISQPASSRGSSAWMNVPSGFFAARPRPLATFSPIAPALKPRSSSAAHAAGYLGSLMLMPFTVSDQVLKSATRSRYGSLAFTAAPNDGLGLPI